MPRIPVKIKIFGYLERIRLLTFDILKKKTVTSITYCLLYYLDGIKKIKLDTGRYQTKGT